MHVVRRTNPTDSLCNTLYLAYNHSISASVGWFLHHHTDDTSVLNDGVYSHLKQTLTDLSTWSTCFIYICCFHTSAPYRGASCGLKKKVLSIEVSQ